MTSFISIHYSFCKPNNIPYWNNPNIHNIGNGWPQALISPLATKTIDILAYNNEPVRDTIKERYLRGGTNIDLCCGTGYSTQFVGVDTSKPMVNIAKIIHRDKKFYNANAETFGGYKEYDTCSIFFALHEIPQDARAKILHNAVRITKKRILICDISPSKHISDAMLSGEPYIKEYQMNIVDDLKFIAEQKQMTVKLIDHVKGRVLVCLLDFY